MNIYVIRHGESEADILDVHEGRADFPLTPYGIQQAKCMANWMQQNTIIDHIYTSSLIRAKQTAEILQQAVKCPLTVREELMEWNNGCIAGLSFLEADERYPEQKDTPAHAAVYGQESMLDFRFRAENIMSELMSKHDMQENIVIVSHGKMIAELYRVFLELPVHSNVYVYSGDTGIHRWKIDQGQRYVLWANRTEHLLELKK